MYVYNLLFNFDKTDGLFSGDDDNTGTGIPAALRASKNWLERRPGGGPFDPEGDVWENLGEATTLMLSSTPDPGDICIRVAPDTRGAIPSAAATLQLAVSFGRPVLFSQKHASPFTHDGTPGGNVRTTFISVPEPPLMGKRNTSRGWFFNLGSIARRPDAGPGGNKRLVHRYEFSLGVIVTDGSTVRHYGEDQEIDVGS